MDALAEFAALEAADGNTLYFSRAARAATQALLSMPVEGGQEKELGLLVDTWGDWDVTDRGIYFVSAEGKLMLYNFATKAASTLWAMEKRP